jgi:protein MpaA
MIAGKWGILSIVAGMLILAVGCESGQPQRRKVDPDRPQPRPRVQRPAPRPAPRQVAPAPQSKGGLIVRKQVVGRSLQGASIEKYEFGSGARPTLIFAGIHGDEVASVNLARDLLNDLMSNPIDFERHPVIVMPLVNPDGYARQIRENSRGVDCNRNFPARNWKPLKGGRSGARPLSEPEADVVYRMVERYQPRQIISIHSIRGQRFCNNYDGPAQGLAEAMSRYNGYPPAASIGYTTPGSFGSWAGVDLGYPVITLELPRGIDSRSAWNRNRDALRAAIQYSSAPVYGQ